MFNWGKNYENLLKVCIDMDIAMRSLANFQATRFANSVRFVFMNLRTDYAAVREAIVNIIKQKENSSDADERKKAAEASAILRTINSWSFCLCLSGCSDVYDLYGEFANVCQQVDILPHERFDKANTLIEKFSTFHKSKEFFELI